MQNVWLAGRLLVIRQPEEGTFTLIMENGDLGKGPVLIVISREEFERMHSAFTDTTTLKIGINATF